MKQAAIGKAEIRMKRAKTALDRISKAGDFNEFSEAWTDFLLASVSILSILEKGAHVNPTSKQWYYSTKKAGRKDPLVRYIVQARNADEHGIEAVVTHVPGGVEIGKNGEPVHVKRLFWDEDGRMIVHLQPVNGKVPTVEVKTAHPKLVKVHDDRFGDAFDPPAEHLGQPLPDTSPYTVASKMMAYLERVMTEARSLQV